MKYCFVIAGNHDMYSQGSSSGGSGRNNYSMQSGPMHHNNSWSQNRGNIDMPNLQSLGINPNGQNGPPNQGKQIQHHCTLQLFTKNTRISSVSTIRRLHK